MSKGLEQTFLQRRYADGQQAHEKMEMQIKTTRYPFLIPTRMALINNGNSNKQASARMRRNWNPCELLVGM